MVLLLSHGQATVKRGFSVNRQVDDDNLHADTFCCRHLICDTGLLWWHICHRHKQHFRHYTSYSSAWHKYQLDLEQKKKDAIKDTVTRKRKAVVPVDDEIQSLKRKKLELPKKVLVT